VPVLMTLHFDGRGEVDIEVSKDLAVRPSQDFFRSMTRLCGRNGIQVQMKATELKRNRKKGNGRGAWKGNKGQNGQATRQ